MPGIFGFVLTAASQAHPSGFFDGPFENAGQHFRIDQFRDCETNVGLGRVSLGFLNTINQPVSNDAGSILLIFHGELYNNVSNLSDPEYILKLYLEKGEQCVSDLTGVFHFAVYEKKSRKIKLFSDKFGLQPLYYTILDHAFLFAGEIKTLLRDNNVSREPNENCIADFFHYGQALGTKTLFKHINLLPPASVLTYHLNESSSSLQRYWHLEDLFVREGKYDLKSGMHDAVQSLLDAIHTRTTERENLGLSLSGGLDSRTILAGLGEAARGLSSYTLGLPGCADQRLTEMMARMTGTVHEFVELDRAYLEDYHHLAQGMIWLSDGMYHPHESTEMLALKHFKTANFKILLRGHGGEIAKAALAYPVMVEPGTHLLQKGRSVLDYIFHRTNLVKRDIASEEFFTRTFLNNTFQSERRSLEESCGSVSEFLDPADVCIYYYINEHIRRQVVASLEIFRSQIEIRLPFVDEAFIKAILQLPICKRNRGEVHIEVIKKVQPALLRIADSNTGAPLDASRLRLFVSDKFNSLSRRFSILGYKHYTEFERWYRTTFRQGIECVLFNNNLSDRGILNMTELKKAYELHRSGQRNYAHLLGTAVGIELWFRNFVD